MRFFHSNPKTRRSLVLAGLVMLAACMSDDGTDPPVNGGGNEIQMTDQLTFSPASLTIDAGETVTWRNTSSGIPHTATGDPDQANDPENVELPEGAAEWDSGSLAPGETFSRTFTVPGTYRYFCDPHESQGMVGTLTVNP